MQNKPNIFFIALFTFIILTISYKFFTLLEFPNSSIALQKGELITVNQKESLTQTFVANRENLTKIEFLFRTPGPAPASDVLIELKDESCSKTIQKGTLSTPFLNSDNLYEFSFAKIPNSLGKKFCIAMTFKSKNAAKKNIRLFSVPSQDAGLELKNITTGETFDGKALSMRPVFTNDHWWQNLSELSQRMSQYKPWFLKHFFLDAIIILFVILSIGLVAILITL